MRWWGQNASSTRKLFASCVRQNSTHVKIHGFRQLFFRFSDIGHYFVGGLWFLNQSHDLSVPQQFFRCTEDRQAKTAFGHNFLQVTHDRSVRNVPAIPG